jgi:uncharacterized protein YndB with AHSA1/START domain
MLIRKPVSMVFEAFVNPEITTRFWFTGSTGRLATGRTVTWEWEMFGAASKVKVKAVDKNRRILIEWDGYKGRERVEWTFLPIGHNATFVTVTNSGFHGSKDEIVRQALDSTGGFTWLLAGLKAYLEHGIRLNLVSDSHPKGV